MFLRGYSTGLTFANWKGGNEIENMASSTLLLPPPPSSSTSTCTSPCFLLVTTATQKTTLIKQVPHRRNFTASLTVAPSTNQTTKWRTSAVAQDKTLISIDSASDIVRNFYNGINAHDLASVQDLISENCVYEDLVFPQPFVGRKAILEFFKKFTDSISRDLQFVIDDISSEDSLAVGVTWHLEWQGRPFPFSKGCSFYRLEVVNGKKQIIYGRDSVEPAIKPGETALVAIKGVTWLLQRFPQLADRL